MCRHFGIIRKFHNQNPKVVNVRDGYLSKPLPVR